jgi:hypothetical protein
LAGFPRVHEYGLEKKLKFEKKKENVSELRKKPKKKKT